MSRIGRKILNRRGRLLAGAVILGAAILYLSQGRDGGSLRLKPQGGWDKQEPDVLDRPSKGKGKGKSNQAELANLEYIVDRYGDYFYPSYPNASHIPSFDPDISLLPLPSELFPEIQLDSFFRPPKIRVYPDSHLREIISPHPTPIAENLPVQTFPEDAFVLNWTGTADWDYQREQGMKIQFERKDKESDESRRIRGERAEAVKRGFAHAWQAYKDHAWGELITAHLISRGSN